MSDFFMDVLNGNDANNGTTFANRWLTITSGATFARIAAGDRIKIMKSPDPTSLAQNVTFTNKSDTLILTSALTANISLCEGAWTASTNVTAGTNSLCKQGTVSSQLDIAAGFTTGKIAYIATDARDYSSYQQASLWIYVSANVNSGVLKLSLCSDTTGDVEVDALTINNNLFGGYWHPITIDKGSALGASIQSVALYAISDPGTVTIYLDNILACKASGSADSITHRSLIGKNTAGELWYPIRSINGTTIKLDVRAQDLISTTPHGYAGTTATTTGYKRECLKISLQNISGWGDTNRSGTSGSVITFSGGWNETDMTTQTGETWIDLTHNQNDGVNVFHSYNTFEKIHFVRANKGFDIQDQECTLTDCGGVACTNAIIPTQPAFNGTGTIDACSCSSTGIDLSGCNRFNIANLKVLSSQTGNGVTLGTSNTIISITGTLTARNCRGSGAYGVSISGSGFINAIVSNDNYGGIQFSSPTGIHIINSVRIADNVTSSSGFVTSTGVYATINSFSSSGHLGGGPIYADLLKNSYLILKNPTYSEASLFAFKNIPQGNSSYITIHNDQGVADTHITYTDGGTIQSDIGADRHTASGMAWKLSPTSTTRTSYYPLRIKIAELAVESGIAVTFSAYVKRSASSTISARLILPGSQVSGVSSDVISNASAGSGTYENLSINFTPSENGVVSIYFDAWGGTTATAWIDDCGIA